MRLNKTHKFIIINRASVKWLVTNRWISTSDGAPYVVHTIKKQNKHTLLGVYHDGVQLCLTNLDSYGSHPLKKLFTFGNFSRGGGVQPNSKKIVVFFVGFVLDITKKWGSWTNSKSFGVFFRYFLDCFEVVFDGMFFFLLVNLLKGKLPHGCPKESSFSFWWLFLAAEGFVINWASQYCF